MLGYLIPVGALFLPPVKNMLAVKNALPRARETMKWWAAIPRNRDLRFPVAGISRKTSGSQNIKFDMEWYVGSAENEIDCGLVASSDFGEFYLMLLYRNVALSVKSSPELVAPKTVHWNIMPGFQVQVERVQVVFSS
jgi:hypothetical protein